MKYRIIKHESSLSEENDYYTVDMVYFGFLPIQVTIDVTPNISVPKKFNTRESAEEWIKKNSEKFNRKIVKEIVVK